MQFLEKDLEQIIYESNNVDLRKRGLDINGRKKRQVRIGNYGIADMITYSTDFYDLNITVYELKQNEVNIQTFLQALRYIKGISHYICGIREKEVNLCISMVMIGKTVQKGDFIYIPDFIDSVKIYTYSYELDGLSFTKHSNYSLTNHGLNG